MICKKKAGGYAKQLNIGDSYDLKRQWVCRCVLYLFTHEKVLPKGKAIFPQEVFNVRVRAKMLMKKLSSKGNCLHHMEFKPTDKDKLFEPLDEETEDVFDQAVECSEEVLLVISK